MKRYRTLGALAIASAASVAILASTADAHSLAANCTTVDASAFPEGQNTATIDVLVNGVPDGLATYAWTVPPPAPPFPVPYTVAPFAGDLVQVYGSFTSDYDQGRTLIYTSSQCGPVKPPPAIVPPPVVPPSVVVPPPPPKTRKPPRKVHRLTCAQLRRHHAGLGSLIARHCALPKRPPFEPPVAG